MENQDRKDVAQNFLSKNHNFMDELMQNEFNNWIEQYMREDTPENEKILNYDVGTAGYSTTQDNSGIIKVTFDFTAETASKDSIWKNFIQGESNYLDRNTCYIELEVLDEENYQINYIGAEPKNLAEFQKQFEKYQEEHKEVIMVSAEDDTNLNSENVLKVSTGITMIAGILIVFSVGFVIMRLIKLKK